MLEGALTVSAIAVIACSIIIILSLAWLERTRAE
jgi:hypothetical protein